MRLGMALFPSKGSVPHGQFYLLNFNKKILVIDLIVERFVKNIYLVVEVDENNKCAECKKTGFTKEANCILKSEDADKILVDGEWSTESTGFHACLKLCQSTENCTSFGFVNEKCRMRSAFTERDCKKSITANSGILCTADDECKSRITSSTEEKGKFCLLR